MTAVSPLVVITLLSAAVSAGVTADTYRRRDRPGARAFAVVMAGATLWAASYAVALATFDPALRRLLEYPAWIGRLVMPVAWIVFALQYTGRGHLVTKRLVAALSVSPAVTVGIMLGSPGLMWRDYRIVAVLGAATAAYVEGPWLVWQTLYAYILIGAGLLVLLEMAIAQGTLYRGQAAALIGAAVVPTAANVAWLFDLGPIPTLDLTPLAFSVTGVLMLYALFRHELFGLVPATRRVGQRAAIDDFGDGVVIVDDDGRVVDLNDAAERILDTPAADALGRSIGGLLDASIDVETDTAIERDGREYEVTSSPVSDQHDRIIGRSLVFHDVTERERRKQRLSVLNRVLRHNLRNDMNVVIGYARMLAERADEGTELAERIEEQSRAVAALGEKARDIEKLLGDHDRPTTRIEVARLLDRLAAELRDDHPAADVTVRAGGPLRFEGDVAILEAVLREVAGNALEHNDAPAPSVELAATDEGDAIEVEIADDGPGLPEHERRVVESGEETPLEHGSGLGLWLVAWGVAALGGEVRFGDNDPRGTVVTIRVPSEESTAAAGTTV